MQRQGAPERGMIMIRKNRWIAALLIAGLLCTVLPLGAQAEEPVTVAEAAELQALVAQLNESGGTVTAELEADIAVSGNTTLRQGSLTLLGGGHKLTGCFLLAGDAVLTLGGPDYEETLQVDSTQNSTGVFDLSGTSVLNLYDGVTIGPSTAGGMAGGIQAHGQTQINMYGGAIRDCHSALSVAGAVYLDGNAVFTMYDGVIEDCTGVQGGAVGIAGAKPIAGSLDDEMIYAAFHMQGGVIRNCTDKWLGGGAVCIYTSFPSRFIMDGGVITGCSAANTKYGYGGAVMVYTTHAEGLVELNGGEITGCSAKYGGGVFVFKGKTTVADGFRLCNNTAAEAGDDIYNNGADVTLGEADATCVLDGCEHNVDGWYEDVSPRWSCEQATAGEAVAFTTLGESCTEEYGLKAAHGNPTVYTVTFEAGDHGSFAPDAETAFEIPAGQPHPTAPVPEPDAHFAFAGWYCGDEPVESFPETVTEDVTYTARWARIEAAYTVEHYREGHDGAYALYETEYPLYGDVGSTVAAEAKDYSAEHYHFSEGNENNVLSGQISLEGIPEEQQDDSVLTLKLYYDLDTCTVTFDTDGGTKIPAQTVRWGETAQRPANPKKQEYRFDGWYLGDEPYDFSTPVTEDITLTARWSGFPDTPTNPAVPAALNGAEHFNYLVGDPDGLVHPERGITRAEAATLFFRLLTDEVRDEALCRSNDFSDVTAGDWFNTAVSTVAKLGILKGYPDGTFRPAQGITRAEFAAIAARFDETVARGGVRFSDTAGHWAEEEIARAADRGWVRGYPDGTFRPDNGITRAEAVTLINRVLHRDPASAGDLLPGMITWPDNADPAAWYYLDLQEAGNSHEYQRGPAGTERWIRLLPPRDWTALEK